MYAPVLMQSDQRFILEAQTISKIGLAVDNNNNNITVGIINLLLPGVVRALGELES